jgi:hypothetical protein
MAAFGSSLMILNLWSWVPALAFGSSGMTRKVAVILAEAQRKAGTQSNAKMAVLFS